MKTAKFFFSLLIASVLLSTVACSSDDSGQAPPIDTNGHGVEVCIVFAPKDMGDQGYADRVLAGMFQFDQQLSPADYDRVLLRYVTPSDNETLHELLLQWDKQGVSAYTRKPFERRLLVLTSATQLQYLADTPLSDTDEVLVLNVVDSLMDKAPRKEWLGPRLHSLCISAADAAKKLCQHIDYQLEHPDDFDRQRAVWLLQLNFNYSHPDSIYEVLRDHYGDDLRTVVLPRTSTGIDFSKTLDIIKGTLEDGTITNSIGSYCVYSCGYYNPYFYAYFYTHKTNVIETAFVDTGLNDDHGQFLSIVRHYEQALCQWLSRWLEAPSATMPAREWHGEWDGYADDNIETYNNH